MLAKLLTYSYNSLNYAGTLGAGLATMNMYIATCCQNLKDKLNFYAAQDI